MRGYLIAIALTFASASALAAPPAGVVVDRVVLVVNGWPVFESEVVAREAQVLKEADGLDATRKVAVRATSRKRALELVTDEALLVGAARDLGLAVLASDLDAAVAQVKAQNGLDDAQLSMALAAQGFTLEEYRESLERQLMLLKVQNVLIRGAVLVDETQVREAYDREQAAGGVGSFESEHDRIYSALYQAELIRAMQRWLDEQRKRAFIESKVTS